MRSWQGMTRLVVECVGMGCLCLLASPLFSAEGSEAFLDGLRAPERRYYDVALDYLEAMRTSPLADKAFRETIDYQIGVTLLEESRTRPLAERETGLDKARASFQKFLLDRPQHPLSTIANRHLANILVERGQIDRERARQPGTMPEDRDRLLEQARRLFHDAQKAFAVVDAQLSKTQRAFGKIEPDDVAAIQRRNQVRSEIVLTRFAMAKLLCEIASTYESGGKESRDSLLAAAAKFDEYYWKYERWFGGCAFRIEEARCYKELGDYARACTILDELAVMRSDDEGFRHIRTAATELALQTRLLPQVKKYKEAWVAYEKWEGNSDERADESDRRATAVRYLGGQAALELARSLDKNDAARANLRAEYLKRAKDLLSFAASSPGEYRLKARLLLADPLLTVGELHVERPKDFGDACDRAKLAWDRLGEGSPTPEQADRLRAEAKECFRFALAHSPDNVKIDDLNVIRYCLAYMDWATEDYYDAAVLGEFLARRYPNHAKAQQGAEIALKAYAKLCGGNTVRDDRRFETGRMTAVAEFITGRWPKSPVADEAWMMLIRAAMAKHDWPKALQCLGRINADSPRRADAELMTGQALWNAYVEDARLPAAKQPTRAEMAAGIAAARKSLEDGVARLRKPVDAGGEVPYSMAAASLALAQICLQVGEGTKAVEWLDDPKIGAHTLAKAKAKTIDRGNFRVLAFETALRAYAASQQLEKAEQAMNALEKSGGAVNIAQIYMSLGRKLEASLKRLRAEGNQEEAAKAARGFEFFLTRPAAESSFSTLYWVAETFMNLGDSLVSDDGKPPPEAMNYYKKAAAAYKKIIDAADADKEFAPQPGALVAIQIRLARCLRRQGKFDEALKTLVEILKTREALLEAQREAAYTYQAWGEEEPGYFMLAIRGGHRVERKDGNVTYLVWGWGGIARKVQETEKFNDIFNEARYNVALCRLKYADSKAGQEQVKQLRQAEADILVVQRIRPEMGGEKWYDQYDALLRKIQGRLGIKENKQGLKAAEQALSPASK